MGKQEKHLRLAFGQAVAGGKRTASLRPVDNQRGIAVARRHRVVGRLVAAVWRAG